MSDHDSNQSSQPVARRGQGFKRESRFGRHFKLVEALGTLLVLFAWWLNWSAVEKWTSARSSLDSILETLTYSFATAQINIQTAIEAAATREALRSKGDPDRAPREAEEVRRYWQIGNVASLHSLDSLVFALHNYNQRYHLALDTEVKDVRARIESARRDLGLPRHMDEGNLIDPRVPTSEETTPEKVDAIDAHILATIREALSLAFKMKTQMEANLAASSRLHRALFLAGTVLLIVAKLLDWQLNAAKEK